MNRYFALFIFVLLSQLVISNNNTARVFTPFTIDIDPMERLLLINIENDPDSIYIGFEPQVFDDSTNGKGHLVIAWRTDGKVDVYHQPSLKLKPEKYNIAGKGLANMIESPLKNSMFTINENGVQASYEFIDLYKRKISFAIHENNSSKRKPFGLLAPMGHAAENPEALPLVLLHDFYFVRQKHTLINVTIDGQEHEIDKLPMPMDGTRMYFARYSPSPFIVTFNNESNGPLPYFDVRQGDTDYMHGTHLYNLAWNNNKPSIESISRNTDKYEINIRFNPAFPSFESLESGGAFSGEFSIEGHYSTGTITGHYFIGMNDSSYNMELVPSGGWLPRPDKLSLRFLYSVGKAFKNWPKTYLWNAEISNTKKDQLHMKSSWTRIDNSKLNR